MACRFATEQVGKLTQNAGSWALETLIV